MPEHKEKFEKTMDRSLIASVKMVELLKQSRVSWQG